VSDEIEESQKTEKPQKTEELQEPGKAQKTEELQEPGKAQKTEELQEVFLCHCGKNIAGTVGISELLNELRKDDQEIIVKDHMFLCSEDGQKLIKDSIKESDLDRVVVASCSPIHHGTIFTRCIEEAGLNPYMWEMANIREHCSWVHHDSDLATKKAFAIIKGAINRVRTHNPIDSIKVPMVQDVMVIGGGITGMHTAIELGDKGFKVALIEKSSIIGGNMVKLDRTFPTDDCSMCTISPILNEVSSHENVDIFTMSEVLDFRGRPGEFYITVRKRPRYIDEKKCTGCGDCTEPCPVELFNEFNHNLGHRKAAYIPHQGAVPNKYAITKLGEPPCRYACPAHINVQGYVALIRIGKFKEALNLIREKCILPSVCGYVCPHFCEHECNRKDFDSSSVSIRDLKRFVADHTLENNSFYDKPENMPIQVEKTGKKVAIIGSGPAGLAAGANLAIQGHDVTIFEKLPIAGGMLAVGIPEFRLPGKVLQADIDYIKNLGVEIKTGVELGKDITIDQLKAENFNAIFLGIGAHSSRKMDIPGENLNGIIFGTDFLRAVALKEHVDISKGSKVAVVGGGNVAIDAARTAVRLGAEVTILYRRSKSEMPAYSEEINEALDEGVKIKFLTTPTKFIDDGGKLGRIECIDMELGEPDESGRRRPVPVSGSEKVYDFESAIIAISQVPDTLRLNISDLNLNINQTIIVDKNTCATNVPGLFAGGDVTLGPATVIEAIHEGNRAANGIHEFLTGNEIEHLKYESNDKIVEFEEIRNLIEPEKQTRNELDLRSSAERVKDFQEIITSGFSDEVAISEAGRCLNCGVCSECMQCAPACKAEAIDHGQTDEVIEFKVGAVVVSTGYEQFDLARTEYNLEHPNVITGLELERLLNSTGPTTGKLLRPFDNKVPESITFIQCAGSRDERHCSYCSKICCMYTTKNAGLIRREYPDMEINICYIDFRAAGRSYEEYYRNLRSMGINLIKGRPSEILDGGDGSLVFDVYDMQTSKLLQIKTELVILSTAMIPSKGTKDMISTLHLVYGPDGFIKPVHVKIAPVDTSVAGIFIAGTATGPKPIQECITDASAAASRVASFLKSPEADVDLDKAIINTDLCMKCGLCADECNYDAIDATGDEYNVIEVACQGCGKCAAICPTNAIDLQHYLDHQITAQVDGILDADETKETIIAYVCTWCGYNAADIAGVARYEYPANIRIVRFPCTGRMSFEHMAYPFTKGAKGVMVIGCLPEQCHYIDGNIGAKDRALQAKAVLDLIGIGGNRLEFFNLSSAMGEKFKEYATRMVEQC
jgi:heterodisulfide reductase subunit A